MKQNELFTSMETRIFHNMDTLYTMSVGIVDKESRNLGRSSKNVW